MISRYEQFENIVTMSVSMLEKGQASEWPVVAALQVERDHALTRFFLAPLTAEEAKFVAPRIEKILALDAKLMELGVAAHRNVVEMLSQIQVGHQAQQAYTQVAGSR
jgi:hypothetical protein